VFRLNDTGETVSISNYFSADYNRIERVELSDGTALDLAQIEQDVVTVTASETGGYLYGFETDDTLIGQGGADRIYAGNGSDRITGGAGNDLLDGQGGADELIGGVGNDSLTGGAGSDTYLFSTGDGTDVVNNYDTSASSVDIARFEDVSIDDLWFSRSGNNLQIVVAGTDDQVTINHWYSNTNYQLDQIEVGSSVLLNNQVEQLVSAMASYSTPNGAGNVIPQDVKDELQPLLVEVWQTM
jgi:Ca2+-binding RTX toxin-like protein